MLAVCIGWAAAAFAAEPAGVPIMLPAALRLAGAAPAAVARVDALFEAARQQARADGVPWRWGAEPSIRLVSTAAAAPTVETWCAERAAALRRQSSAAVPDAGSVAALYRDVLQTRGEQAAAVDLLARADAIAARAEGNGRAWERRQTQAEQLARRRELERAGGRAKAARAALASALGLDPATPLDPQEPFDLKLADGPPNAAAARATAAETRLGHAGRAMELCLAPWLTAAKDAEAPATPAEALAVLQTLAGAYAEYFEALHAANRQALAGLAAAAPPVVPVALAPPPPPPWLASVPPPVPVRVPVPAPAAAVFVGETGWRPAGK